VPLPPVPKLLRHRPRPGSGDFSWDIDDYAAGNALVLYVQGKTLYPAMADAIGAARETVHLETYIFGNDQTGRAFAELLAARARAGVRVRVIYDAIGSLDLDPVLVTLMRNSGVQLLEYHPVAPWRPRWAWNKRDHRKLLICDGRAAFVGGMNLCDEHAPADHGGGDWRDAHVRVEGPAALQFDLLFREVWSGETGRWFEPAGAGAGAGGPSRVKVAANQEFLKRFVIREAYVNALRAAKKEVSIANAYFIPGMRIRHKLAQAARRGVNVRVMVPGHSDNSAVWNAMRAQYDGLLSRGVRIFEWQGPMMHAKAVVVDRAWCSIGTFNLDHRSLQHNLEVNANILDPKLPAELADQFELGLKGSREIILADWRRRPWMDRVRERFCESFDYFF
jgi:cardiolipin synthase